MAEAAISIISSTQVKAKQALRDAINADINRPTSTGKLPEITVIPFGHSVEIEKEKKKPKRGTLNKKQCLEKFKKDTHSSILNRNKNRKKKNG